MSLNWKFGLPYNQYHYEVQYLTSDWFKYARFISCPILYLFIFKVYYCCFLYKNNAEMLAH